MLLTRLTRRHALIGLIAAPAIVRASSLMPIKAYSVADAAVYSMDDFYEITRRAYIPVDVVEKYWSDERFRQLVVAGDNKRSICSHAAWEALDGERNAGLVS